MRLAYHIVRIRNDDLRIALWLLLVPCEVLSFAWVTFRNDRLFHLPAWRRAYAIWMSAARGEFVEERR